MPILIPVSLVFGIVSALVFRRFTDRETIRLTLRHITAHVMEFWLFIESPAVVFQAQRDLLRENLRLLRHIFLPSLILAALFAILYPEMDALCGRGPLTPGEPAVVTASADCGSIEAPRGILVETPGIVARYDHTINWRVRPLGRVADEIKVRCNGRLTAPTVLYPRRTIFGLNWMVWFFAISSVAGLAFRPATRYPADSDRSTGA